MLRWPIRLKLMVGLSLVVGMMLILMGGSIFGLHAFHMSNLTLTDQLREIGASKNLFASVLPAARPARRDRRKKTGGAEGPGARGARGAAGLLPRAEEEHDAGEPRRQRPRRAGTGAS